MSKRKLTKRDFSSSKTETENRNDADNVAFPWEHEKRFLKLQTDDFYLLNSSIGGGKTRGGLSFDVSGSTGNVYRVELSGPGRRFSCTCPDAISHARRHNVECKHVLFVVYRVLRSSLSPLHFLAPNSRKIADNLYNRWLERTQLMQTLLLSNDNNIGVDNNNITDVINQQYRQRFLSVHSNNISEKSLSQNPPGLVCVSEFKGRCGDEDCPVCFMPILETDDECNTVPKTETSIRKQTHHSSANMLVQCDTCLRALHRECADQWIDVGRNESCVYCRSTLLYAKWRISTKKKKTKKTYPSSSSNAYINVATPD